MPVAKLNIGGKVRDIWVYSGEGVYEVDIGRKTVDCVAHQEGDQIYLTPTGKTSAVPKPSDTRLNQNPSKSVWWR